MKKPPQCLTPRQRARSLVAGLVGFFYIGFWFCVETAETLFRTVVLGQGVDQQIARFGRDDE